MRTTPRPQMVRIHHLMFLALLVTVPGQTFAQARSVAPPEHASANRYGSGWACDRGYGEANGACLAVMTPPNAYPTGAVLRTQLEVHSWFS